VHRESVRDVAAACWTGGVASAPSPVLRVRVLGPIRAVDGGGRDVTPDGSLQRRLLALLVLRRGLTVNGDVAIDVLWPTDAPLDPVAALHSHVSRLRRALPAGTITSTAAGYGLDPSVIDLDADRLADLVHQGAALDAAGRSALRELLDGWHGPAYPELEEVDAARAETTRLAELRQLGFESLAEARLTDGDLDGLVADLAALADDAPLRERPRALLMEALARSGRVAEALRAYDDFRRLLADELGIEPSAALRAQHDALLASGGPGSPPAPAGAAPAVGRRSAGRLPAPVTSLVGRDALADELAETARRHRVVTLVGPGGVGKTRMLAEIGRRLAGDGDRAVVWCELAPATEASAVDAVADALDIEGRPDLGLDERVVAAVGDDPVVLLLDNCEHVLDPVSALAERLLSGCPNLALVATSRERLRVSGEHLCPVPPLPLTNPTPVAPSPAAELFTERARAVAPTFDPGPGEQAVIADIVRRLDGLPLAIELAAARLLTHDVAEVAAGLDDRFTLLTGGIRSSARQGSLAAAVGWSYDLLEAEQQQVFADLSIFSGPFTAETAEAVCTPTGRPVALVLDELLERSLLLRAPSRRYVLLETLKAFGAERLAASGRLQEVGRRHAHHYAAGAEAADLAMLDPSRPAIAEIDEALSELRSALAWLLEHGDPERAGQLVVGLLDYGVYRLRPDVLAWADRVAAADPDDRSPVAPDVWAGAAYAAWMAGDLTATERCATRALAVQERSGAELSGEVGMVQGSVALFGGRLDDAVRWFGRSAEASASDTGQLLQALGALTLALGYQGGDSLEPTISRLLAVAGDQPTAYTAYAWYCAGEAVASTDVELARTRLSRALELAEATNASFVTGIAGATLASIAARSGDAATAAADYKRLVAHWRRAEMWSTQWTMLRTIAGVLADLGKAADAAVLVGAVQATQAGHRIFGVDEQALAALAERLEADLGAGAYEEARRRGAAMDGDAAVDHALSAL
jgi:predicted ATPase/DNA-binding SARP family transcriptional activator